MYLGVVVIAVYFRLRTREHLRSYTGAVIPIASM